MRSLGCTIHLILLNLQQNSDMKRVSISILLTLSLVLASCGSYTKVQKTTDYLYKYEAAKEYYASGLYNRAALLLQDVIMSLKGTERGEESLYLIAMANYKAKNFSAAQTYFKKYYQTYPKGLYAEEAYFYSGRSLYMDIPPIKLDQTVTYEAINEFQSFLELYPQSKYSADVQDIIYKLQDRLVEKEYLSAKLYYDLGTYFGNCASGGSNFQACIITAENAVRDYPFTSRREDFAILILKAKFDLAKQSIDSKKEERYHNAIDEYYGFTNEFPESVYMKEAQEMFSKAEKYVKSTSGSKEN